MSVQYLITVFDPANILNTTALLGGCTSSVWCILYNANSMYMW